MLPLIYYQPKFKTYVSGCGWITKITPVACNENNSACNGSGYADWALMNECTVSNPVKPPAFSSREPHDIMKLCFATQLGEQVQQTLDAKPFTQRDEVNCAIDIPFFSGFDES